MKIIKAIVFLIWVVVVVGLFFLIKDVFSLDMSYPARWGWVIIAVAIFAIITLVTCNVLFSKKRK